MVIIGQFFKSSDCGDCAREIGIVLLFAKNLRVHTADCRDRGYFIGRGGCVCVDFKVCVYIVGDVKTVVVLNDVVVFGRHVLNVIEICRRNVVGGAESLGEGAEGFHKRVDINLISQLCYINIRLSG